MTRICCQSLVTFSFPSGFTRSHRHFQSFPAHGSIRNLCGWGLNRIRFKINVVRESQDVVIDRETNLGEPKIDETSAGNVDFDRRPTRLFSEESRRRQTKTEKKQNNALYWATSIVLMNDEMFFVFSKSHETWLWEARLVGYFVNFWRRRDSNSIS